MERMDEVWSPIFEEIQKDINQSTFNLWFSKLQLIDLTEKKAVILASNMFNRNILRLSFQSKLEDIFERVLGFKITIDIVCQDDLNKTEENEDKPLVLKAESNEPDELSEGATEPSFFTGNEGYTFENFIVGNSNKLAHAACIAVANSAGYDYNPLFIHGPSGLGKTHLLHAIANHIKKKNSETNIVYVTSEQFTNQLIRSISNKTTNEFRNKFRNADILMIDDIQFIASRENTQEEIFHTFNALYEKGVQIILTSDRPARDIKPLEDRLLTRFNWGVTADINPPDFELRAAIITSKAQSKGIDLSPEIINLLAEELTDNIRQLEGAVKKLCAIKILSDKEITLETAANAIKDIIKEKTKANITVEKILETVSKKYGISIDDLKSKSRVSNITNARQIAMYIIRKKTDLSLPKTGKVFNRDHATVVSSVEKVEKEIKCNSLFEIEINELIKEITMS